jgi:plastocyanin
VKGIAAVAASFGVALVGTPGADVNMPGRFYSPTDSDVLLGTIVTFHNADTISHTVTADDDSFDSGFLRSGATFTRTFDTPGIYKFHCRIHRFMRGEVRVFALVLTGPDHVLRAGRPALLTGLAPSGTTDVALEQLTQGRWAEVARRAPGEDGAYSFTRAAQEPTAYRARADANASPIVRVQVAPQVDTHLEDSMLAIATRPARPGSRIHLQVYVRERFSFRTVSRSKLDPQGRAEVSVAGLGGEHVRVLVVGNGGWSIARSRSVVVPGVRVPSPVGG